MELAYRLVTKKYWVGLDDMQVAGQYVWADGHHLTSQEVTSLFAAGQPDSAGCCEDCVAYWPPWEGLNDIRCSHEKFCVCEIVM